MLFIMSFGMPCSSITPAKWNFRGKFSVGTFKEVHTLRSEVVQHLGVDDPVNRVEDENLAGNEPTLKFIDEEIIPWSLILASILLLV